ncbi:putative d-lactate dehydrogenase [Tribonema minus]|uniref:D-lactate dehydrogenase (cytochrome) n=1 Tax=Tribonema minus TaxID=303371 RepID=A0A835YUA6_9STRA|nr:putative d-lactate dehydrogenase [Tribonema minus]
MLAAAGLIACAGGVLQQETTAHSEASAQQQIQSYLPPGFVEDLIAAVGRDNVCVDEDERESHGKPYNSYHKVDRSPDVIVCPGSTEEVSAVVRLCARHKIPIVPYGGATSVEGQLLAPSGGVSLDFARMKEVVAFSRNDHDVTVQAGLGYIELNDWLRDHGLWFPLDPGPGASVGGMSACRCSGSTAVRYGTMRENVVSMTAVLPNGDIIKTGGRAKKSAAGYDLTRLLVGSEGTLAVITEVTLKVHKIPTYSEGMRVVFRSIAEASAVVQDTLAAGVPVGRAEMLDNTMMKIINVANAQNYPEETTVLFEFAGESPTAVREMQETVAALASRRKPLAITVQTDPAACKQMWRERKEALWAAAAQYPDLECMITDVLEVKTELDASWLPAPIVAHAGDGNFHCLIFFDSAKARDVQEVARLSKHMVERALAMEGTCTGEHGVGYGKIKYLQKELNGAAIRTMVSIKNAIDPNGIMNPGKVVPHKRDPVTGRLVACG